MEGELCCALGGTVPEGMKGSILFCWLYIGNYYISCCIQEIITFPFVVLR